MLPPFTGGRSQAQEAERQNWMGGYAAAQPSDYAAIVVLQVTSLSCHHRCSTLFNSHVAA